MKKVLTADDRVRLRETIAELVRILFNPKTERKKKQ